MLFPCDVANSAPEQIITPIITVARGPMRLYTLATKVLKIPNPTIANEPTRAEKKGEKVLLQLILSLFPRYGREISTRLQLSMGKSPSGIGKDSS